MLSEKQKQEIIKSAKDYFKTIIIPNHLSRINNLKLSKFNVNPFLVNYLAAFLCGDTSPESIAKALIYPRILGTSITTSFGQNIQIFISTLENIIGGASAIDGIDIEFIDAIDHRKKYCQLKAGPQTINNDDIGTILGHFKHILNKARLDRLPLHIDDLIVGVLYGEESKLSPNYKAINSHYPVFCGKDFWEHLTGDATFYYRLSKAFGEVVEDEKIDGSHLISLKIKELAEEIKNKGGL